MAGRSLLLGQFAEARWLKSGVDALVAHTPCTRVSIAAPSARNALDRKTARAPTRTNVRAALLAIFATDNTIGSAAAVSAHETKAVGTDATLGRGDQGAQLLRH